MSSNASQDGRFQGFGFKSRASLSAATGSLRRAGRQVKKLVKPRPAPQAESINTEQRSGILHPFSWLTRRFRKSTKPGNTPDTPPSARYTIDGDDLDDTISCLSQFSVYFPRVDEEPAADLAESNGEDDEDKQSAADDDEASEDMDAFELYRILTSIQIPPSRNTVPNATQTQAGPPTFPQPIYPSVPHLEPASSYLPFQPFSRSQYKPGTRRTKENTPERRIQRWAMVSYLIPVRRDDVTTGRAPWMTPVRVPRLHIHRTPPAATMLSSAQDPATPAYIQQIANAATVITVLAFPVCRMLFG